MLKRRRTSAPPPRTMAMAPVVHHLPVLSDALWANCLRWLPAAAVGRLHRLCKYWHTAIVPRALAMIEGMARVAMTAHMRVMWGKPVFGDNESKTIAEWPWRVSFTQLQTNVQLMRRAAAHMQRVHSHWRQLRPLIGDQVLAVKEYWRTCKGAFEAPMELRIKHGVDFVWDHAGSTVPVPRMLCTHCLPPIGDMDDFCAHVWEWRVFVLAPPHSPYAGQLHVVDVSIAHAFRNWQRPTFAWRVPYQHPAIEVLDIAALSHNTDPDKLALRLLDSLNADGIPCRPSPEHVAKLEHQTFGTRFWMCEGCGRDYDQV